MSFNNSIGSIVLNQCLEALGLALEYNLKDFPLHQHAIRVGEGCVLIGEKAGLEPAVLRRLYFAGLLHDVGKMSVPIDILQKRGKLTEEEFAAVRRHTVDGSRIIASLPGLNSLAFWIRWHHERWDGSGYPDGLAGTEIPLEIQILSAMDCFDSLQTPRMDRDAHSPEEAFRIVREYRGKNFNPDVVDLIFEMHRDGALSLRESSPRFLELKDKYLESPIVANEKDFQDMYGITGLYPVLRLFARVIDAKHHYTSGHSTRVSILSKYLAGVMGFSMDDLVKIEIAGLMHDAGKISIPVEVLDMEEYPSEKEWEIIKLHPVHSADIIRKIEPFQDIAEIVYYHHAWADGRGYPGTPRDASVAALSRIIAIADAYDAITTDRPYSRAQSPEQAYHVIRSGLGSQFDISAGTALVQTPPKYITALFDMNEV